MATSGNTNFLTTTAQIYRQAALLVNAIGRQESMPASLVSDFTFSLNALIKNWQNTGIHLWTTREATLFPTVGQYQYRAGTAATDHITETYYSTKVTVNAVLSGTLLTVDSTTNITIGDFVGVVIDNGTIQWTTVANKSATTITLTAPLVDSVKAGNKVFTYTTKISRPLRVVDARRFDIAGERETPILMEARKDYRALPTKRDAGSIVSMFYDAQLTLGVFNLWRVPNVTTDLVNFTWYRPMEVFVSANDNPDLPEQWVQALIWNLALVRMPMHPVKPENRQLIMQNAAQFLDDAKGFDREGESIFVAPNLEGYR